MATEIEAIDGQEHRMLLGEVETLTWRLNDAPAGETLSSASYSVTGTSITATEAFLTTPDVGYRITAAELGTAVIEVTLNTSLGNTHKHRLSVDVYRTMEKEVTSLVVEDGTGTEPTANSYATHDQLINYAVNRGVDYTSKTVAELDALMYKAMDYIESKRRRFQGYKTTSTQPLQWPREDVYIDEALIDNDVIPTELIYAQLALAIEAETVDLMPTITPETRGPITKEKIDRAVEVTYGTSGASTTPNVRRAEAFLAALYKPRSRFAIRA